MKSMFLVGFFQAIFLGLLILLKRKKKTPDYWLAAFILIIGLQMLFLFLDESGWVTNHPRLIFLDVVHWTTLGPLLYLYIRSVIFPNRPLKADSLIHLAPMVLVLICYGDFFLNQMDILSVNQYTSRHKTNPTIIVGSLVWGFSSVFYYILSIIRMYRHRKNIVKFFSTVRGVNLNWLNLLSHGFALFLLLEVVDLFSFTYRFPFINFDFFKYSWLVLIAYLFAVGLIGYRQKGIFSDFDPGDLSVKNLPDDSKKRFVAVKYSNAILPDNERAVILEKLLNYMEREKPYLDCDLHIKTVADSIGTTIHKLSQVINESLSKNFFDFVNDYRIEEVKKQLAEPENQRFKIISVAYNCGFNSKSAFYEVFRKSVGQTPSEYRQKAASG
jgi:AraC-like DNA-binding protein